MTDKPSKSVLLFFILFGTMFLFGFIENIKGVAFPLIKMEFNASHEQQGAMVSLQAFSYVLFSLAGGILLGRFGIKKAFACGFAVIIAGLAVMYYMGGFWTVAGAMFIVAAGTGFFEVSSNALATQLFTSKAALLMNLLHFFYGAGSSFSPRAAGFISASFGWRYAYLLCIPLVLAFFIPSLFARFPSALPLPGDSRSASEKDERVSFFMAVKTPMVWVFSVVLGLLVAVELSSPNWAGLYFRDMYQLDPKTTGAAFVSNFFILFTVSRLISGFAIEKIGYMRSLFICTAASIFVFILGFSLGANGIYVLPALGFFTAIFWPTVLATAMGYFGKNAPIMTSAIIVIAGTINAFIQFFIGLTNRLAGPAWGYRSCIVYAAFGLIALVVLAKKMQNRSCPVKEARHFNS